MTNGSISPFPQLFSPLPSHSNPCPCADSPDSQTLLPFAPPPSAISRQTATPLLLHRRGRGGEGRGGGAAKPGCEARLGIMAKQSSASFFSPQPPGIASTCRTWTQCLPFGFEGHDFSLFLRSGLRLPPPIAIPSSPPFVPPAYLNSFFRTEKTGVKGCVGQRCLESSLGLSTAV